MLRAVATAGLLLALPAGGAPRRKVYKVYVDEANGVRFAYPAAWLLNGDDDAATAKLRITTQAQPKAVVQLEGNFAEEGPYKDTDFESAAFAYVVQPGSAEQECFAVVERIAEDEDQPVPPAGLWNGMRAQSIEIAATVAGTIDRHQIAAIFRNARCYLFETVIIRRSADTVAKPLSPARWNELWATLGSVLRSVRVVRVPPNSSPTGWGR